MTQTYGTLKDAIAEEIHEPSDAPVVKRMVQSTLLFYRGRRFAFSEASDIISVRKGYGAVRGVQPPHIDRPTHVSGQSQGNIEGAYALDDGRSIHGEAGASPANLDFLFPEVEYQGVGKAEYRVRWRFVNASTAAVKAIFHNPESSHIIDMGDLTAAPDLDGYTWSKIEFPIDQAAALYDHKWLWNLELVPKTQDTTEYLEIEQVERFYSFTSMLPAGIGGIDAINVDSSSGIWHTMTGVTISTMRKHETSRVLRGVPNVWSWHNQTLYLYPHTSRDLRLKIDYLKDATRDENTGLEFDTSSPDEFTNAYFYNGGELLLTRACALYFLRRAHDQDLANQFKLANQEIEDALRVEKGRQTFHRKKVRGYWSEGRGSRL